MTPTPHIWMPKRGMFAPSPIEARRERCRRLVERETRTYTGRVLLPGSIEYEREVACLGVSVFYPGLGQVRREVTVAAPGGGGVPSVAPDHSYRMEEATGATRADSAGSANLASTGSVSQVSGKLGNAASVAGNSEHLTQSAVSLITNGAAFTVGCWINVSSFNGTHGAAFQFSAINTSRTFNALIFDGSSNAVFSIRDSGFSTVYQVTGTTVSTGTWTCIVCGWDSVAQEVFLTQDDTTYTAAAATFGLASQAFWVLSDAFEFGMFGGIDALSIWNGSALSLADRTAFYNGGTGLEYYSGGWH